MSDETTASAEAIRSLIARVAHAADEAPLAVYAELYTEDAVWEMTAATAVAPPQTRTGIDDIVAASRDRRAAGIAGPGESPDSARAESVWMFYADTTTAPRLSSMGRYHDTFRRVDGRWLLARRIVTVG